MTETVDVVVAGAGPAGLAAAIVLARNGLRVLICDPRPLPIDKACGEGILPHGLLHLEALGARPYLDHQQTRPFVGIRFWTANGVSAAASFQEGPGLGVRRVNLSQALARCAEQWPTLEWATSALRGLEVTDQGVRVALNQRTVQARLVVGADGLGSQVRRWAGLEGRVGPRQRFGLRQHYAMAPWSDHVEVHYGSGMEIYVTPCGPELVGVACLWTGARPHPGGEEAARGIRGMAAAFPRLAARLAEAPDPPATPTLGSGPFHRTARARCGDGVLLLGDAGGYLDACTGEGLSLAFGQALALETTVIPLLQKTRGFVSRRQLAHFSAACHVLLRPYLWATRCMLYLGRHPRGFARFVAAMHDHPHLLQTFFSLQMGTTPVLANIPRLMRLAPYLWKSIPTAIP